MLTQLPGIVDLIGKSFARAKPRYGSLMATMLLPVPFIIPLYVVLVVLIALGVVVPAPAKAVIITLTVLFAVVIVLAYVFLGLWSTVSLMRTTAEHGKPGIIATYKQSLPFILPLLWSSLLVLSSAALGFVALIIPAIILRVYLGFTPWIVTSGEAKGLKALALSAAYVRGSFWAVLWRTLVPGIILFAATEGITIGGRIYLVDTHHPVLVLVLNLVVIAAAILLVPIICGYQFELFTALKHHKGTPTVTNKQRNFLGILAGGGILALIALGIGCAFGTLLLVRSLENRPPEHQYYYDNQSANL